MSKEILFFSAPWCVPCKQMKLMFSESIQNELSLKIIDIAEDMELAADYQIMTVPTFIVIKDGKEVTRKSGSSTIDELRDM